MTENYFSSVFHKNPVAIALTDLANNQLFEVNNSWEKLTGYKREEAIGSSPLQLKLWTEPEKRDHLTQIIKEHKFAKDVVQIRKKSGENIIVLMSAEIIELSDDQFLLTMGQDITELKETERALRKSKTRYRAMMESLADPVSICSQNFTVEYINPAMIKRLGHDATGEPCYKALHGLNERCEWCNRNSTINKSNEANIVSPLDDRTFHITNMSLKNNDGSTSQMSIFRDMTDYLKALSERENAQSRLVQSDKMASIGQLAAGVAHEINNPIGFVNSNLNTLKGYHSDISILIREYRELISHLKEKKDNSQSVIDLIEKIASIEEDIDIDYLMKDLTSLVEESAEGTERVKIIVNDLKNFAHPGTGQQDNIDINRGIESTLNVVGNELKYKVTVNKELGEIPLITGYPQQLNQVFMNLFVNAAHAITDKGEINIKTFCDDGCIVIKISDTGSGIPKKNLPRLFDPFFTTKEVGKGTGLGLNVAFNIIEKHNGTISVSSKTGKGATFTIKLPADRPTKN